ncbi:ArsR/SmtB family transcription factor [Salinibacterium soli]|uniref:Helix-turn-helix domain-containing protein n=1 Tax=Antiquaquibacter soli TaxID=3064523 RepID=A0ABT9BNZ4_9MICO|nr:helix-turn-helix domain-containing protein [Protaetiibacter sp. WY-16]MDO7882294.1 helix-turn-helix domain-containing protein [Protaetiibacter sp. WY-16]
MSDDTPTMAERKLDMVSLKALAHPLRVQLLDHLSVHGASTASALADKLGESSGATSYHLRQLAKHGFVREVEGRGTGRERWWERVPGGIALTPEGIADSEAGRAASALVMREWEQNRAVLLQDFVNRGYEELDMDWILAGTLATANLRLTREQLAAVVESWDAWAKATLEPLRGRNDPGSRPVQFHFNAFPVLGGAETPLDPDGNVGGRA